MSTEDTQGSSLEDLLSAILCSGTPLAADLREQLHALSVRLLRLFPDEPGSTELMNTLLAIRRRAKPTGPGEPSAALADTVNAPASTSATADRRGAEEAGDAGGTAGPDGSTVHPGDHPGVPAADRDAAAATVIAGEMPAPAPGPERDPAAEAAAGLRSLWSSLREDWVAGQYCRAYAAPGADPAADDVPGLWMRVLLTCLRLPGAQADRIREQATAAVADYPDRGRLLPLLPEGLPEDDAGELTELLDLAPELAEQWPGLVQDAAWLTWLAWHDEGVRCADHDTAPAATEPVPFERRRDRFTAHLATKLKALTTDARPDVPSIVSVDEALRGIVPIPLPQPGSWWTSLLEQSTRRLESPDYLGRIHVYPLGLNAETWDKNFDTEGVIRIQKAQAAGNGHGNDRVWILRYPVNPAGASEVKKGRYIAVK